MGYLFSSYKSVPSSPTMGGIRRSSTGRLLKPALILAIIIALCSLTFLGTRNHEYITQNIPENLKTGKILPPFSSKDKAPKPASSPKPASFELPPHTVAQIQNASLGFERVMLINLPVRTDKLDASSLAASMTGFQFTVVDGVKNEDVAPVSLPWNFDKNAPNVHGCWRAHLNALQTVVREGLSTALIIEDDSDWDVNLKAQLPAIAAGTQKLQHTADTHEEPHSPYGDGWDLLWLGHCSSELRTDAARMLIHNDPTVPPPTKKWEMWDSSYNARGVTNSTRVVSKANNGICTNGYAVSLAGARKILYYASFKPNPDAIDQRFNALCDSKYTDYPDFECLHVYPSIFNSYRKAGRKDGDSDQSYYAGKNDEKVKMREHGISYNNVYSTMLNLGNLVLGKPAEMQWKEDGWEKTRELDASRGVQLEWQEAGWDTKAKENEEEEKAKEEKKEGEELKKPSA